MKNKIDKKKVNFLLANEHIELLNNVGDYLSISNPNALNLLLSLIQDKNYEMIEDIVSKSNKASEL